jgi:hypothetical protein
MADLSQDKHTISYFARNSGAFRRHLKETGEPIVLTVNGKAELVVQDAASYQKLLEIVERLETIEGIRAGLDEMYAGKGRPASEFFDEMEREFGTSHEA